jgi:6-phosphogluconolactonase
MGASYFLMAVIAGGALALTAVSGGAAGGRLILVGTYTRGESRGIYAFRFDQATGRLSPVGLAAETRNPSFLVTSADGRYLFAVNEVSDFGGSRSGSVTSFAIDGGTGKLTQLSVQSTRGADPCHLALDRTGRFLAVANYTGGSVAVMPVSSDGRLGPAAAFVQHEGRGADPKRQDGPHAHQVVFTSDNRFLVVADLGLDGLLVYRFDERSGSLTPNQPPTAKVAAGSGPRHFVFHPDGKRAFVINELSSTITTLDWDASAGTFRTGTSVSTLPAGFEGRNSTAEISLHPGGRFLFGSNRGHDSIAVFALDGKEGLALVEVEPTRGQAPRHFMIDESGRWLIAANQASGNLAVFAVDQQTGRLTPAGTPVRAETPVCVVRAPSATQGASR